MSSAILPPGTRLGPYAVAEPVGAGASATVYRAEDGEGRVVAIKVRRVGVPSLDRRFLREFESMRSLRLPGVVRVHEAGIEDDLLWFSMDLVDGRPFGERVEQEEDIAARVARTVSLGRQLLEILGELHQAGFVHRDVKPSNVLVDERGQVKVLDFGIVRFFGDQDTLSDSGQVLGTVPFMAPEQIAGLPFDQRVDLWAAGIMLYEAIDGPRPRPQTPVGWIPRICLERLVPLACKHREVPRTLSNLLERLVSVDPFDRPSAESAAHVLRRLEIAPAGNEWPEPRFVDTGDWWTPLEGCIGHPRHPAVQVLDGPTGSGRRRIAEQIHRQAVMQGVWPVHVRCAVDGVGQPVVELLERLLTGIDDADWQRSIVLGDGEILRRMWPQLPIPGAYGHGQAPTTSEASDAAGRCVARAAASRALLVVVHDLERVDPLSAQTLQALAANTGPRLGLLLLHDGRWESPLSRRLVAELRSNGAGWRTVPSLTPSQAREIAVSLCPNAPPAEADAPTPQRAVDVGLAALAAWRGEPWQTPEPFLWPLVVREQGLPEPVFVRLAGHRALESPWVRRADSEDVTVRFAGDLPRRSLGARLADLRASARAVEDAMTSELGAAAPAEELARLRLLAGDQIGAFAPAVGAAVDAEENGRYADARRWMLVIDMLPQEHPGELAWELAHVRARVALRTEAGPPRFELADACERVARDHADEQAIRTLRAEYQLRAGEIRPALVAALRIASQNQQELPLVAARSLLVATHARFLLGQYDEAAPQLERARAILAKHPEPRLEVQAANWLSELLYRRSELQECRRLLQEAIRRAAETRYMRGAAYASSRLAQVLRVVGKRREAEHQMRSAREAFQATSDLVLGTETSLELAVLRAERGDAAGARTLVDDTIRRIRGLNLDHLLGRAMRVALQIATLRADPTEAAMALPVLDGADDPEAPAALVRWWRTRGDVDRALDVRAPTDSPFGRVLWQVERARAALGGDRAALARQEAEAAAADSGRLGFVELHTYARLLLGVLMPTDEATWRALLDEASASLFTEVYLGGIEMDARRLNAAGDINAARSRWRTLRARAEELGYRPGVEEATGWLQVDKG